jgi:hypothetical protein
LPIKVSAQQRQHAQQAVPHFQVNHNHFSSWEFDVSLKQLGPMTSTARARNLGACKNVRFAQVSGGWRADRSIDTPAPSCTQPLNFPLCAGQWSSFPSPPSVQPEKCGEISVQGLKNGLMASLVDK